MKKSKPLTKRKFKQGAPQAYALWSKREIDWLKAKYKSQTDEAIARTLGRGIYGVRLKRQSLGLKKRRMKK
jgi:hypothetical protein